MMRDTLVAASLACSRYNALRSFLTGYPGFSVRALVAAGVFALLGCSLLTLVSSAASSLPACLASAESGLDGTLSPSASCSFLADDGQAPLRRLQAGVYLNDEDRARKGQIYLWLPLTLVGVLILGVLYMLQIGNVFDPLLHTRFTPSDRTR
ncbi:hypothetical protein BESB_008180 [Besnoitia besnoiti]|uniref:Transmembrane protein n=1 Tax=Besnoitia besnoiti TaxID=94643 RepID=A0A2A9MPY6_BESBE|nr:hypothetical protein BESB_008180 [Besnoitia besnoiti]PFH38476.1 hypothetical protein BESB_008180 [Besnoitia besnoiti]